jgi:hypothetical protein
VLVVCGVKLSGLSVAVKIEHCTVSGSSSYSEFVVVVLVVDQALVVTVVGCIYLVWGQAHSRWETFVCNEMVISSFMIILICIEFRHSGNSDCSSSWLAQLTFAVPYMAGLIK